MSTPEEKAQNLSEENQVEEKTAPDNAAEFDPSTNQSEAADLNSGPTEGAESGPEETVDPVAELQAELDKWRDAAMRNQAELENFRKRMQRERSDAVKYANGSLLAELLPVVDNFQFGLDAARNEAKDSIVFQGMSMVMKQLLDFLADQGVKEVPAEGQQFDPNLHEAVKQESSDTVPEGTVMTVIRRGFKLHDRLLRAANVIVSKGPESGTTPAEDQSAE